MTQQELTPAQHHVHDLVKRYQLRTGGSKSRAAAGRAVLADKSSIGFSFTQQTKEICYPITATRADGAYLWDVDNNQYTDILMGLGTHLFGHNPEFLRNAIQDQLDQGFAIGPQSPIVNEVASLVSQLTGMERVTFSNTGTEAVMTAIRIARTAHKKPKVVLFTNSYHGHSDAALVRAPIAEYARKKLVDRLSHSSFGRGLNKLLNKGMSTKAIPAFAGVSAASASEIIVLEYNNPRSLDIIRKHQNELAAVLVEPVQSRCPELQPRAFLQELREITAALNIALIFDDMVWGFRAAAGGSQAHFGIKADMATYSKITGGGLPLSVIAGSAPYMNHIDGGPWQYGDHSKPEVPTTFFAGTFSKHPLSLATAHAVLTEIKNAGPELYQQLNQKTAALVENLNLFCNTKNLPIRFVNFSSFFAIAASESRLSPDAQLLLSYHLLERGIHLRAGDKGGFLSTAHNEQDIQRILTAFKESLLELSTVGII